MTDNQIDEAIAKHIGWQSNAPDWSWSGSLPPRYCRDLNAMHEAEKTLERVCEPAPYMVSERLGYAHILKEQAGSDGAIFATARERAEAFLKIIGKWKE